MSTYFKSNKNGCFQFDYLRAMILSSQIYKKLSANPKDEI